MYKMFFVIPSFHDWKKKNARHLFAFLILSWLNYSGIYVPEEHFRENAEDYAYKNVLLIVSKANRSELSKKWKVQRRGQTETNSNNARLFYLWIKFAASSRTQVSYFLIAWIAHLWWCARTAPIFQRWSRNIFAPAVYDNNNNWSVPRRQSLVCSLFHRHNSQTHVCLCENWGKLDARGNLLLVAE